MSTETTPDTDRTSPSDPSALSLPQRVVAWLANRNLFSLTGVESFSTDGGLTTTYGNICR